MQCNNFLLKKCELAIKFTTSCDKTRQNGVYNTSFWGANIVTQQKLTGIGAKSVEMQFEYKSS